MLHIKAIRKTIKAYNFHMTVISSHRPTLKIKAIKNLEKKIPVSEHKVPLPRILLRCFPFPTSVIS